MRMEWNYWSSRIASGGSRPKGSTLIANSQRPPASSDNNPVQALADALVGFSEVYSRIEVAKMKLFTKMNLELARLRKRRRKNSSNSCEIYLWDTYFNQLQEYKKENDSILKSISPL
jgi:hypothetical protein